VILMVKKEAAGPNCGSYWQK